MNLQTQHLDDKKENIPNNYPYLARRLFVENPNDIIINFTELREGIIAFNKGREAEIGVHFQYLPSGVTVSVNADTPFFAASLLKLPVAMQVMKEIEKGNVQKNKLLIVENRHIDPTYGTLWKNGVGYTLTVEEALRKSLVESDNTANQLLLDLVPGRKLSEVLNYLDIPQVVETGQLLITPRGFSSILRSLYFSAYLSYEYSNELISILIEGKSENDFIQKPLPSSIQVANKTGIYQLHPDDKQISNLYSECGIVYVPARQYVLCVFVKGDLEKEVAAEIISEISLRTYQFVSSQP